MPVFEIRAVLAQSDPAVVVVDRMLGMGKVVLRSCVEQAALFRLPEEWVDLKMFVMEYHNSGSDDTTRDSNVVMVHCIRKKPFPHAESDALVCLSSMQFPMHLVRHVFMCPSNRKDHTKSKNGKGRSTDAEHLCIIYIHMLSAQIAREYVPCTDPLVPTWDAVHCRKTNSYLHILQQSRRSYDDTDRTWTYTVPESTETALAGALKEPVVEVEKMVDSPPELLELAVDMSGTSSDSQTDSADETHWLRQTNPFPALWHTTEDVHWPCNDAADAVSKTFTGCLVEHSLEVSPIVPAGRPVLAPLEDYEMYM